MKLYPFQTKHSESASLLLYLFFTFLAITGCGSGSSTSDADTSRNLRESVTPQITSARLIDAQGNDVETQMIDGNLTITPREGQQIGFEISFIASKDVAVSVIVNQYTPMDIKTVPEPTYCEGLGCPDPEKGEIPYYGEEIFYEFGSNQFFPIAPFDGPRRYSIPTDIEPDIVVTEDQFTEVETETHIEYFLQIKDYYIVDGPGYERMFRFQVEDSEGYISQDHIIYTNIPL
ncbi:MAG: hypothetical protein C0403_04350 [Desulfobacterium sp.]|nr:hypothetical protein [Desulfobacterium sp.]